MRYVIIKYSRKEIDYGFDCKLFVVKLRDFKTMELAEKVVKLTNSLMDCTQTAVTIARLYV